MAHADVVLVQAGREVRLGPVGHEDRCRLGLVDDLARLQLAARRLGWSIRLERSSTDLADLLDLLGLADVLATSTTPADQGVRSIPRLRWRR